MIIILIGYLIGQTDLVFRHNTVYIASASKYEVRIVGSTTSAAEQFLVAEMIEFAQS